MSNSGMTTYKVEVKETLCRVVEIEAPVGQPNTAIAKAHQMYRNEEIVLDSDDYFDTEYRVIENED